MDELSEDLLIEIDEFIQGYKEDFSGSKPSTSILKAKFNLYKCTARDIRNLIDAH